MLRIAFRTASALAVLVTVALLVPAQVPKGKESTSPTTTTVRAKSVIGAKISLQGGAVAGTVDDIVLSDEGVVEYLIVSEAGKLVTVPWDAIKFNYEKRTAVIDIPAERYREIPTYTIEQYPNFYAPTYRMQIYKYYGLTPGQERRLERRIDRKP